MILLNEVERELLRTKGRLLQKQMTELQKMADKVQEDFNTAMGLVVKGRPMRERPPVEARLVFDEEQGAITWTQAPEPQEQAPVEEPAETVEAQ